MEKNNTIRAGEVQRHSRLLQELTIESGQAIMDIYQREFEVVSKKDSSPLTEADLASHNIIINGLKSLPAPLCTIPVISEEGKIPDYTVRSDWNTWWLIDPLDGTKEFVKKNGEFTVNIALISRDSEGSAGVPIAGWVYAPVPKILYQGILGEGSIRINLSDSYSSSDRILTPKVSLPCEKPAGIPRIVASRSHRNPETEIIIDAVGETFGKSKIISSGSSLKLCRIAEGSAELYPRPAPTMEWDTAAADAVCRAAGARVVHALTGESLEYGKKDLHNPWFLVSRDERLISLSIDALKGISESS